METEGGAGVEADAAPVDEAAAGADEAAAPGKRRAITKRFESKRPTFADDPKYERLAPIFGLSSAAELDTEPYALVLADFKERQSN